MEDPTSANEDLFSVFFVAILSVIVVPWTVSKLCCSEDKEEVNVSRSSGPRSKSKKKTSRSDICLCVLWVVLIGLSYYISSTADDTKPFDPFDILEVSARATPKEIKSAYRRLSLKYHPDKNPDPAAADYFSNYVSKAYKALTDEASRENWEKYGHPDGPKSTKYGVALPSFLFNDKYNILLLGGIVALAILIPVCIAISFLQNSKKYTSNNLLVDTISLWAHPTSPVHIKQAHSIHRVIETLSCAAEFASYIVPKSSYPQLEQLMKNLIRFKAIKEGEKMFKKKVEFVRAHFTLLAFLHRIPVPKELGQRQILRLAPKLFGELVKVASMARVAQLNYGWFAPTEAVVECMQCFSQGVPTDVKRPRMQTVASTSGKVLQGKFGLYQLPHVDEHVIKMMGKGTPSGVRVKTLGELLSLSEASMKDLVTYALDKDLGQEGVNNTLGMVSALPAVQVDECKIYVDGESDIVNFDPTYCDLKLKIKRASHKHIIAQKMSALSKSKKQDYDSLVEKFVTKCGDEEATSKLIVEALETLQEIIALPKLEGKEVMAETPLLPFKKPEKWYVLLGDVKANLLYCHGKVELGEAEDCGMRDLLLDEFCKACVTWAEGTKGNDYGDVKERLPEKIAKLKEKCGHKLVRLGYTSPPAGTYDLTVMILSDSYLGCDVHIQQKVVVDSKARGQGRWELEDEEGKNKKSHEKQMARKREAAAAAEKAEEEGEEGEENTKAIPDLESVPSEEEEVEFSSEEEPQQGDDGEEDSDSDSDSDSDDSVFSDFSYDSQDTGTDIDDADEREENRAWTARPTE